MDKVNSDTYLGDIISVDGRNTPNVDSRTFKALGIVAAIFDILKHVMFGRHYFSVALLLRDMLLVNGILTNSEVWFGLRWGEIRKLEEVDKIFMRRLFRVPNSCPSEAFYLETGCIPISYKIKARRIQYLHHLATRKENELLSKVFHAQWQCPIKNDWTLQVKEDLLELGLEIDLNWIKSFKKYKFKELIKTSVREAAFRSLLDKKGKYSKLKDLNYIQLEAQEYLKNMDITANQARILFKYRTRMSNYWQNFKGGLEEITCKVCKEVETVDSQKHFLECRVAKKSLNVEIVYQHIFTKVTPSLARSLERIELFRIEYLNWVDSSK